MTLQGGLAAQLPGEKFAHGTFTPTAADTAIVTGLEGIRAFGVSFGGVPVITHMFNYASASGGTLTVKTMTVTAVDNATPTPASTPWAVLNWWAIGQGAR